MARTSSIFARVEPEIKDQAEAVLDKLGIPMSNAIDCFLRQVVYQQRIPFEIKIPARKPIHLSQLNDAQLDSELSQGIEAITAGNVLSSPMVRENFIKKYGL